MNLTDEKKHIFEDFRTLMRSKVARKDCKIRYIVLHYAGVPGLSAKKLANRFNTTNQEKSTHYTVDEHEVWHIVRDCFAAWHCGARSADQYRHKFARNATAIGVDLCEDKGCCDSQKITDPDWFFTPETIDNGSDLVSDLMVFYKIPIENVLRHHDVTGKICPAPFCGKIINSITKQTRDQDFSDFLKLCENKAREKEKSRKLTFDCFEIAKSCN